MYYNYLAVVMMMTTTVTTSLKAHASRGDARSANEEHALLMPRKGNSGAECMYNLGLAIGRKNLQTYHSTKPEVIARYMAMCLAKNGKPQSPSPRWSHLNCGGLNSVECTTRFNELPIENVQGHPLIQEALAQKPETIR